MISSIFSNLLACPSFRGFPSPAARAGFFTMDESSFHNQNPIPVGFLQTNKHGERLFSPFANKQVTKGIVKTCKCGCPESDHDRRWDVESALFRDYYPCRSCECDSFEIDEITRQKISALAIEQWQRLLQQNKKNGVA